MVDYWPPARLEALVAANVTLVFSCSQVADPPGACVEYSWLPTGLRHVIALRPGSLTDSRTDQHANVTRIQVYSLRNGRYGQAQTASGWQFPAGPPPVGKHLVGAVIHVFGSQADGCGLYDDGTASPIDTVQLQPVPPFVCGQAADKSG